MKGVQGLAKDISGQVLIIFLLLIPLIVGLVGIGIDIGIVTMQKARIQDSADLAVLAGAQSLPLNTLDAYNIAYDTFEKNFGKTSSIKNINFFEGSNGIKLHYEDYVSIYFISIFGINNIKITGKAEAIVAPLYKPLDIIPIGINKNTGLNISYGQEVVIYGTSVDISSGNFGIVDPTIYQDMQNKDIQNWIAYDYKGERGMPSVNEYIGTKPGITYGPAKKGFDIRLAEGRTIVICPVVDYSSTNGKSQVLVLGFAAFDIVKTELVVIKNNEYLYVTGKFIEFIEDGDITNRIGKYYGVKSIALIK